MNNLEFLNNVWYLAILGVLLLGLIFKLIIYFGNYFKIKRFNPHPSELNDQKHPVSVIICARNEADNLTEFLPKILSQNYPDFEVVIVNDCSYDNTEDVIREYKDIFPNLKSIVVKEDPYYKHGKKFALMVGIKGAKYEHLLFTDADCVPDTENWISEMMKGFSHNKDIVIGYGPYQKQDSFINKLIRYDSFKIALQYLSAGIKKDAYMGVGRNLAYKKELFFKHKGFATHYHLLSGDDDLFVNQAANSMNTSVVITTDSFTYSLPKQNFNDWWIQKTRHLSTAPYYKSATKNKLSFLHATNYFFHLSLFVALCFPKILIPVISIWLVKLIAQFIVYSGTMKKLGEKDLLGFIIIFDILLLFIYPFLHLSRKIVKQNKWKT
jgi:biofilm PGA synthesis N-glycosyltransferase PgaC